MSSVCPWSPARLGGCSRNRQCSVENRFSQAKAGNVAADPTKPERVDYVYVLLLYDDSTIAQAISLQLFQKLDTVQSSKDYVRSGFF